MADDCDCDCDWDCDCFSNLIVFDTDNCSGENYNLTSSYNKRSNDWNHGLCDCFSNFSVCLLATFIPCIPISQNAEQSNTCGFLPTCVATCFLPCVSLWIMTKTRENVRSMYGIEGSFCNDLLTTCFCNCCSVIQIKNQLNANDMGQSMERV